MSLFYNLIYAPKMNWVIRNINYLLSPFLPNKIKIHPSGKLKVNIKNHNYFYLKTNQTSFLTRELFWKKAENFEYTTIFIGLIKKVNTFFDVGANIGYYSILGCHVNPKLKVHAFEPSNGVMIYMCENLKINNLLEKVTVEPIALSDVGGTIEFHEMKNLKFPSIYNLSGEHNIGTKKGRISNKIKTKSTTLDDYLRSKKVDNLELIKLDTEGAEYQILKGASETLEKYRPIIICETLFNKIEKELDSTIRRHNYKFYNHVNGGLKNVETIIRTEDDGVRNCFFIPEEKVHLIEEWLV